MIGKLKVKYNYKKIRKILREDYKKYFMSHRIHQTWL